MVRPKLDMACLTQCGDEEKEPGNGKGLCRGGVTSTLLVRERWRCHRSRGGALYWGPWHRSVIWSALGLSTTTGFPPCGRLKFGFIVVCLQARSTGNCSADKTTSTASTVVRKPVWQPAPSEARAEDHPCFSDPEPAWVPVPFEARA